MAEGDETVPPASGEVDAAMRLIVCSRRARLVGEGDVTVVSDVADLLIALHEERRTAVLVDAPDSPIELGFFARLARDFPPTIAVLVQGDPVKDRRAFHDLGVYRAQFEPSADGALPEDGSPIDRTLLVAKVAAKLERAPTPLISLARR